MKKKIDPNLIIAIGVLIASFSALFVYMRQASIMSDQTEILLEQTKANAWPRLSIETDLNWIDKKLESLKIKIHNKGTGPALVEGVRVTYDGIYTRSWGDLFDKINVPDSISTSISNKIIYNAVLSANENYYWLRLIHDPNLARWLYNHREKITIEICYRSVFEDYWLLTVDKNGYNTTKKLDTPECPIPSGEMFKS
ncbi:hypothetical protein IWQ47_004262 [Aquimarina sp. EL_43]|uniref:hypothetical protein n=1 Tax=unclassified Aquimarina TaxID=2627091 RepID=UPI0018C95D40|nr:MULTISPECIES: hypothetical protein [unclassified Aquimarina]MBG6133026.1 hypothetical protein [Aquimarina sp. EL_35]MBG6152337.1 hypothetical protein [Aquimarina sp. EL_32]MBG6171175.1 hypothetical protein [Aquimarina sp. EL_43]